MIKTLRVSKENHTDMVIIQSKMQIKEKEIISMDKVLTKLIQCYKAYGGKMK